MPETATQQLRRLAEEAARPYQQLRLLGERAARQYRKSDLAFFNRANSPQRSDDERVEALQTLASRWARRWKPSKQGERALGLLQSEYDGWTAAKIEALKVGILLVEATQARRIRFGNRYIARVLLEPDDLTLIEADRYFPQRAIREAEKWLLDLLPEESSNAVALEESAMGTESDEDAVNAAVDARRKIAELFELCTPAQRETVEELLSAFSEGYEEDEARATVAKKTNRSRSALRKALHDIKKRSA